MNDTQYISTINKCGTRLYWLVDSKGKKRRIKKTDLNDETLTQLLKESEDSREPSVNSSETFTSIPNFDESKLARGCQICATKESTVTKCVYDDKGYVLKEYNKRDSAKREVMAHKYIESHPNITRPLHSYGRWDQRKILFEYYPGSTMSRRTPKGMRYKLQIASKICKAVQYLHSNKLVHLDIKPNNIVFKDCWEPILIDFGFCSFGEEYDNAPPEMKHGSVRGGTPNYMSFSMHNGNNGKYSDDIYSLGVTLYYLFNSRTLPWDPVDSKQKEKVKWMKELFHKKMKPRPSSSGEVIVDIAIDRMISYYGFQRVSLEETIKILDRLIEMYDLMPRKCQEIQ